MNVKKRKKLHGKEKDKRIRLDKCSTRNINIKEQEIIKDMIRNINEIYTK